MEVRIDEFTARCKIARDYYGRKPPVWVLDTVWCGENPATADYIIEKGACVATQVYRCGKKTIPAQKIYDVIKKLPTPVDNNSSYEDWAAEREDRL